MEREWEFFVPFLGILVLYFFIPSFETIFIWLVIWTGIKIFFIEGRDWSEPEVREQEEKSEEKPEVHEEKEEQKETQPAK